jgi:hypothetical protein
VRADPRRAIGGGAARQIRGIEPARVEEPRGLAPEAAVGELAQPGQIEVDPRPLRHRGPARRHRLDVADDRVERRRLAEIVGHRDDLVEAVGVADQAEGGAGDAESGQWLQHGCS